jgi:D-sedoheptulose 7-phosphate isomerase
MHHYFLEYIEKKYNACKSIDSGSLIQFSDLVEKTIQSKNKIFFCGNGGSLAIANHMLCDLYKQASTDSAIEPLVYSLSSNFELITAISNDIDYSQIFSYQLNRIGNKGDILITISSSGDSQNIIEAINVAKKIGIVSVSLTGFNGGRSKENSDLNIHVNEFNYGIIEDSHQTIIHAMTQFLRSKYLDKSLDKEKIKF